MPAFVLAALFGAGALPPALDLTTSAAAAGATASSASHARKSARRCRTIRRPTLRHPGVTVLKRRCAKRSAASPPLRFGAYAPPSPEQGMAGTDALQAALHRPIDISLWYQHWDGWGPELVPDWIRNVTASGRTPLLTWEPWGGPGTGVNQPRFSLARIVAGDFDPYLARWGRGLAALRSTVYLRPMHEMNGNWYPWAGTVNGNSAALYVAAWRHVHDVVTRQGAKNVRWVFSPFADDVPATAANAFERYYPGSRYVDVLALDNYNWGSDYPQYGGWRSFESLFRSAYDRIAKLGSQPVWIGEVGSDEVGGSKPDWVRDMFATVKTMPRVAALVWFNAFPANERDWRATSSSLTAAAFSLSG